jgi:hypothetical protein
MTPIENLKSQKRFAHAGALAFALGCDDYYGCHYGMRQDREAAMVAFRQGWATARQDYNAARQAAAE